MAVSLFIKIVFLLALDTNFYTFEEPFREDSAKPIHISKLGTFLNWCANDDNTFSIRIGLESWLTLKTIALCISIETIIRKQLAFIVFVKIVTILTFYADFDAAQKPKFLPTSCLNIYILVRLTMIIGNRCHQSTNTQNIREVSLFTFYTFSCNFINIQTVFRE